jgi:hypothetical protein
MDEQLCRKVFYILRKQGLLETTRVVFTVHFALVC